MWLIPHTYAMIIIDYLSCDHYQPLLIILVDPGYWPSLTHQGSPTGWRVVSTTLPHTSGSAQGEPVAFSVHGLPRHVTPKLITHQHLSTFILSQWNESLHPASEISGPIAHLPTRENVALRHPPMTKPEPDQLLQWPAILAEAGANRCSPVGFAALHIGEAIHGVNLLHNLHDKPYIINVWLLCIDHLCSNHPHQPTN